MSTRRSATRWCSPATTATGRCCERAESPPTGVEDAAAAGDPGARDARMAGDRDRPRALRDAHPNRRAPRPGRHRESVGGRSRRRRGARGDRGGQPAQPRRRHRHRRRRARRRAGGSMSPTTTAACPASRDRRSRSDPAGSRPPARRPGAGATRGRRSTTSSIPRRARPSAPTLAHGERRGGDVPGREHRQHRSADPRGLGPGMARAARTARASGRQRRRRTLRLPSGDWPARAHGAESR